MVRSRVSWDSAEKRSVGGIDIGAGGRVSGLGLAGRLRSEHWSAQSLGRQTWLQDSPVRGRERRCWNRLVRRRLPRPPSIARAKDRHHDPAHRIDSNNRYVPLRRRLIEASCPGGSPRDGASGSPGSAPGQPSVRRSHRGHSDRRPHPVNLEVADRMDTPRGEHATRSSCRQASQRRWPGAGSANEPPVREYSWTKAKRQPQRVASTPCRRMASRTGP